jgi:Bacterial PH domain
VATWVVATKFAVAGVFALTALLANGRTPMIIALLAAVGMATYGLRDVLVRERLRVEADGLTVVHGFASRGRLGWDQIERVRVDERLRLGVRTQLLEVDAGDWIGLYGRYELDAEPEAVVAAIDTARPNRSNR